MNPLQLNPMVEVTFDAGDVGAKPEEYFKVEFLIF